jgi:hypothetical protein
MAGEAMGRQRQAQPLLLGNSQKSEMLNEEEYLNTTQQVHLCDGITEYKRPHKIKSENKKNKKYYIQNTS